MTTPAGSKIFSEIIPPLSITKNRASCKTLIGLERFKSTQVSKDVHAHQLARF